MKLTINQLSRLLSVSQGAVRNWCLKIEVGQTFTENFCNIENVKRQMLRLFNQDTEKLNKVLNFDYNELEIVRNERKESEYVNIDDLEENKQYILRHYHYEKNVTFVKIMNVDDETKLYLFRNNDETYEVYTTTQLNDKKMNIKEIVE